MDDNINGKMEKCKTLKTISIQVNINIYSSFNDNWSTSLRLDYKN